MKTRSAATKKVDEVGPEGEDDDVAMKSNDQVEEVVKKRNKAKSKEVAKVVPNDQIEEVVEKRNKAKSKEAPKKENKSKRNLSKTNLQDQVVTSTSEAEILANENEEVPDKKLNGKRKKVDNSKSKQKNKNEVEVPTNAAEEEHSEIPEASKQGAEKKVAGAESTKVEVGVKNGKKAVGKKNLKPQEVSKEENGDVPEGKKSKTKKNLADNEKNNGEALETKKSKIKKADANEKTEATKEAKEEALALETDKADIDERPEAGKKKRGIRGKKAAEGAAVTNEASSASEVPKKKKRGAVKE